MDIDALLRQIASIPNCRVNPPNGMPKTHEHSLPTDLKRFYELCGGVMLFQDEDYVCEIVSPNGFVLSNPVIMGEQFEGDITSHWFIAARDGNGDCISIDLHQQRLGKCYDSFWDRHGIVGECPVIAKSFTELLNQLVQNKGERWYWLREDFESLGDAYDEMKDKE